MTARATDTHDAHSLAQAKRGGFAHPQRNIDAFGIRPGQTVVDFGSGSGAYVLAIAERLRGSGHVYAIDVQQLLLRRIKNEAHKRHLDNIETIWSDLEAPGGSKIADGHADLVLISNLLFQVEHKPAVLAEAKRIINPAGTLILIDWSDSYAGVGPLKKDVVKKERAIELAEKEGFDLRSQFEAGEHHYGLLFRPKLR